MPTPAICTALLFGLFALCSCNEKKVNNVTTNNPEAVVSPGTEPEQPGEVVELAGHINAFTENITQHFTVPAQKVMLLTGRKGLKITIDPAVLETMDGKTVNSNINVSMIELTNCDDLFKSNAATISNGRLLASGGSYFIGMSCKGQALRIRKGKSLAIQFPRMKKEAMQLFYGNRNEAGDMNWESTDIQLKPETVADDDLQFADNNMFTDAYEFPAFFLDEQKQPKIFRTLKEKIYYYDKQMTIRELVDTINRYTPKIFIDTIYMWPKQLEDLPKGARVDSNYLNHVYGPPKQFMIKTYYAQQKQQEKARKDSIDRALVISTWKPSSVSGQLQKYYTPGTITNLGWLNCDRFVPSQLTDVMLDLPITFNKNKISYFVLVRSMNGLINGRVTVNNPDSVTVASLPVGATATLIAFTKFNGQLMHCKKDFTVQRNKRVMANFETISAEELTKIFGKNVALPSPPVGRG